MDKPLFQASPSELIFRNFTPEQTYKLHLHLHNNDKVCVSVAPSEPCRATLQQGTASPNAEIVPRDNLVTCPEVYLGAKFVTFSSTEYKCARAWVSISTGAGALSCRSAPLTWCTNTCFHVFFNTTRQHSSAAWKQSVNPELEPAADLRVRRSRRSGPGPSPAAVLC